MMRVFLTGGSGFLGAAVASELVRRGVAVTCLVRAQSPLDRLAGCRDRITIVRADLEDAAQLEASLQVAQPDAICHAAWAGVFGADRNDPAQNGNVAMTARLARAGAAAGAKAFIGIGSQAEYGPLAGAVSENDPVRPTTRYGKAKVAAHDAAAAISATAGMRFAWLRVFSLYGPDSHRGWLLPYVIDALLRGEKPSLTPAEQRWDFLHVADAAGAVADVMLSPGAFGLFNLGSGTAPSLRQTIEMARDLIDPGLPLGFGEVAYRPDQVMWLEADITRLTAAVKWAPTVSLRAGLQETIDWLRRA